MIQGTLCLESLGNQKKLSMFHAVKVLLRERGNGSVYGNVPAMATLMSRKTVFKMSLLKVDLVLKRVK